MKKVLFAAMAWSLMCMTVQAVPVKPGVRTHAQSDGTTLRVEPVGDEWFRAAVTAGEGLTVARGADGDYYYRTAAGLTSVLPTTRSTAAPVKRPL